MTRALNINLVSALYGLAFTFPCIANTQASLSAAPKDELVIVPYVWAPVLTGNVGLGPLSVPIHVQPGYLAKGVKSGGMGYVQLRHRDKFVYAEGIFVNFHNPQFAPFFGEELVADVRFGEFGGGITRTVKLNQQLYVKISPYIGVRYTRINATISGALLTTQAGGEWVDPALGVLVDVPITRRLSVTSKIDASGFDVTSNRYYSAAVVANFNVAKCLALVGGYRFSSGKYNGDNGFTMDLHGSGPVVGLTYRVAIAK